MRTIEIIITADGQSTVQTKGFAGPACRDASRFIEQALGDKTAETLTAEFHLPPQRQGFRNGRGRGEASPPADLPVVPLPPVMPMPARRPPPGHR